MLYYISTRKYFGFTLAACIIYLIYSTGDGITTQNFITENYYHRWNPESKNDIFKRPPLDSEAIRDICSATSWNRSLLFTCDNNSGDVAKVRNSILNCVRYTISAGGSLILPRILEREMDPSTKEDSSNQSNQSSRRGLDYMFDEKHFLDSLQRSCPELVLVSKMTDTGDYGGRRRSLLPESLFPNLPTSGLEHPEEWPQKLNSWIEENIISSPSTAGSPIIIDLEASFLHYPTHSDGHAAAHVFGNILQFRSDIRHLATKTLSRLVDWYEFPVNISHHGLLKPSFLGAHLNTENPLLEQRHLFDVEFSHYEAQAEAFLQQASDLQLSTIYISSENYSDLEEFCLDALSYNVAVTFKEALLDQEDLTNLNRLTYDQREMVDFLVLTKAEEFVGIGHSPYSWNVALAREQLGAVMDGKLNGDIWKDGMNTLFGVRKDYVESSYCMWS